MKKISTIMMSAGLVLFLSIPAFAEEMPATSIVTSNIATTSTGIVNSNGIVTANDGYVNNTRAYATNDNRSNWGWLGLLGLLGLAGMRNRSGERGK